MEGKGKDLKVKLQEKLTWAIAEKEKCIKALESLKDQISRVKIKETQLNGCIFVLQDLLKEKEQ